MVLWASKEMEKGDRVGVFSSKDTVRRNVIQWIITSLLFAYVNNKNKTIHRLTVLAGKYPYFITFLHLFGNSQYHLVK